MEAAVMTAMFFTLRDLSSSDAFSMRHLSGTVFWDGGGPQRKKEIICPATRWTLSIGGRNR
jgi:hypothetical protein